MYKIIVEFFDKFEDANRRWLSRHPAIYALIGGLCVVLFWRGAWTFFDFFDFMTPVVSIVVSSIIMLATGTFVSFFIGQEIIMSGLKAEKRIDQKTEKDIEEEDSQIRYLLMQINQMSQDIDEIKKHLLNKNNKTDNSEIIKKISSKK